MMHNKKTISLLAALLITLLFMSMLSACSTDQTTGGTTPQGTTGSGTTKPAGSTGETLYFNETGLPIVDTPITMSMMIRYFVDRGTEPSKNDIWIYLQELTNINFEFNAIESSGWAEKLNLALAGGNLPDIIYNGLSVNDLMAQTRTGNFIDMKDYIADYAPAITELMENNKDVRSAMVMPDGGIRSFVWTNMEIEKGRGQCPPDYVAVNQKWLDALDLDMPTTPQELYDVMYAFRNEDPNGNGQKDEIPLAPRMGVSSLKYSMEWFGKQFGSYDCFVTDEGVVEYVPFTDEYKQWIEFMIDIYANELIDKEFFTMDRAAIQAKGSGDTDIYGVVISSAPFTVVGQTKGNDFMICPVLKAPNGSQIALNRTYANPGVFAVTKNCKYVEAAVRFADLFYTDEYVKLVWMGIEGEAYKFNADGSWDWIYTDTLTSPEQVRAQKTIQTSGQGPSMCPVEWFLINDPVEGPVNKQREWLADNFGQNLRTPLPVMYYDLDVQRQISDINANINDFHAENMANFIMGRKDFAAEYDNFIQQLKTMGAEDLVKLVQQTYDANQN